MANSNEEFILATEMPKVFLGEIPDLRVKIVRLEEKEERKKGGVVWFLHKVKRKSPLLLGLLGLLTSSAPLALAIAFVVRRDAPSVVRRAAFVSPFPKKEAPSPAWYTHPIPAGSGLNLIVDDKPDMEPPGKPAFMSSMGQDVKGLAWNEVLGYARNLPSINPAASGVGAPFASSRLGRSLAPVFGRAFNSSAGVSFGSGPTRRTPGSQPLRPQGFVTRTTPLVRPRPHAVGFSGSAEGHVSQLPQTNDGGVPQRRGGLTPFLDNAAVRIDKDTAMAVARATGETPCLGAPPCRRAGWTDYNKLATVDATVVPALGRGPESASQLQTEQWDGGARTKRFVANADGVPEIGLGVAPVTNHDNSGSPILGDGDPPRTVAAPAISPVNPLRIVAAQLSIIGMKLMANPITARIGAAMLAAAAAIMAMIAALTR